MTSESNIKYCKECGQRMDWSDKQGHYYCAHCGYEDLTTNPPIVDPEAARHATQETQEATEASARALEVSKTANGGKIKYCRICGRAMDWSEKQSSFYCAHCGHVEYVQPPKGPSTNDTDSNKPLLKKKVKTKKRRGGCLGGILKFLLSVVLIIGLIIAGFTLWNKWTEDKRLQEEIDAFQSLIPNLKTKEEEDAALEELLKNTPSDIEGLSQWDKAQQGLHPNEGSDTDGDGLTDKDEIEVYKTDPKKASTSGDGIPDGIKVQRDLDLTKSYNVDSKEYKAAMDLFPDNISFRNIGNSENALANVWEKEYYKVAGTDAIVAYSVINYNGTIDIDFTKHMESGKSYAAMLIADEETKSIELVEGKVVAQITGNCVIALIPAPEEELSNSAISVDFDTLFGKSNNDTMIVSLPILQWVGLEDEVCVYVFENNFLKNGQKYVTYNADLAARLGYSGTNVKMEYRYHDPVSYGIAQSFFNTFFKYDWLEGTVESNVGSDEVGEIMAVVKEFMPQIVQFYDIKSGQVDEFIKFIEKGEVGTDGEGEVTAEPTRPSKYVTSFNIAKDAMPFPNFGSYISAGGNCAGMAQITMQLFNKSLYEPASEKTFTFAGKEYPMKYDISNVDEMDTFFDKYLNDYKSTLYWLKNYPDMEEMKREDFPEEDAAFLDFCGYKWMEENASTPDNIYMWGEGHSWSSFEKLMEYFEKNDKILCVDIAGSAKSGKHTINAYGIEQDPNDSDVYYILVYDNNFPNNKAHALNGKYITVDGRIKVTRIKSLLCGEYIEWSYAPSTKYLPDYMYGSYFRYDDVNLGILGTLSQYHCLCLFDENFNMIMG